MKKKILNDLYAEFNDRIISRCKLESSVFIYYFNNQKKTCLSHWKTDEYEDFVSWFYPRLRKAIDKYYDKGASFEAFINKYFFIASKEYKVHTTAGSVTEYSTWSARIPDLYVHEEPPDYLCEENDEIFSKLIQEKSGRKNIRRILALILKCYSYVSDDFIEKAALLMEIDKEELYKMLDKIRKLRQKKDDVIYNLKEKLYCQFYRCIVLEKKLSLTKENTLTYNTLEKQLKNGRIKFEKTRIKLSLTRKEATNSQVAKVIGVCKGSVDSSLHKLKKRFNLN
jgi:hypothetical protein